MEVGVAVVHEAGACVGVSALLFELDGAEGTCVDLSVPVVQAAESGVVVGLFVVAALLLLVPAVCAVWCVKGTRVGVGVE